MLYFPILNPMLSSKNVGWGGEGPLQNNTFAKTLSKHGIISEVHHLLWYVIYIRYTPADFVKLGVHPQVRLSRRR